MIFGSFSIVNLLCCDPGPRGVHPGDEDDPEREPLNAHETKDSCRRMASPPLVIEATPDSLPDGSNYARDDEKVLSCHPSGVPW